MLTLPKLLKAISAFALISFLPILAAAQGNTYQPQLITGNGAPGTGATQGCAIYQEYIDTSTGNKWHCLPDNSGQHGSWVANANPSSLNSIIFVDGVTYPKTAAGINSALAASAARGNGGTVYVDTTGGGFNLTSSITWPTGWFGWMICTDGNSPLTYTPTTGTMLTLNPSSAIYFGWGVQNCNFTGPGSGTSTTGLTVGGTNGAAGAQVEGVRITGFGTGLTFGSNTFLNNFRHDFIVNNGQNMLIPSGLTVTGESIVFEATTFANTGSYVTNCVQLTITNAPNLVFRNGSFDNCQYVQSGAATSVEMEGMHHENPSQATINPFIVVTAGNLSMVGPDIGQTVSGAVSVPTSLITVSGGVVSMAHAKVVNNSSNAITNLVGVTSTGSLHEYGSQIVTGTVSNLWNYGGSGCVAGSNNSFSQNQSIACGPFQWNTSPVQLNSVNLQINGGSAGSFYLGGTASGNAQFQNNTGQTVSGITGTLWGVANATVGWEAQMDTSGNFGIAGGMNTNGASRFFAQGTTALPTGALSANTCSAATTVAVTNATTSMRIQWNLHSTAVGVNGYGNSPVTINAWLTTGNINFIQCATTAVTPGTMSVDWTVF